MTDSTNPTVAPTSATPTAVNRPSARGSKSNARGGSGGAGSGGRNSGGGNRKGGGGGRGGRSDARQEREFEQKLLDLSRVTRVTGGGKRMRFRAALVIGDKKGRVGFGVEKGLDVAGAVEKAYRQAKKKLITVPMVNETIPHEISSKFGAAKILLKPAPKGTGLKSGGAVRVVLEIAGVPNVVSKILGSSNKINIAKATLAALQELSTRKKS